MLVGVALAGRMPRVNEADAVIIAKPKHRSPSQAQSALMQRL